MAAQMGANARWVFWSSSWCVRGAAGLAAAQSAAAAADSHTQDDFLCEVPFTSFSLGFSLYYRDKQLPTEPCAERGYAGAIFVRARICLHVRVWVRNTGESVAMHFYMSSHWSFCTTHHSRARSSLWMSSLSLMHQQFSSKSLGTGHKIPESSSRRVGKRGSNRLNNLLFLQSAPLLQEIPGDVRRLESRHCFYISGEESCYTGYYITLELHNCFKPATQVSDVWVLWKETAKYCHLWRLYRNSYGWRYPNKG